MEKLQHKKADRAQLQSVLGRSLLLSIALAACLLNLSLGQTTASAVVDAEQDLKLANSAQLTPDARASSDRPNVWNS